MFSSTNYRLTRSNKSNASRHDVKKDKERRYYNDDDDDDNDNDDDDADEDYVYEEDDDDDDDDDDYVDEDDEEDDDEDDEEDDDDEDEEKEIITRRKRKLKDEDEEDEDEEDEEDEDDEDDDKTDKSQTTINIKLRDGDLKHIKRILNPTHRIKLNIVCSVKTRNKRDATPDTCSTRGIYLDVASFIFGIGVSIAVYVMYNCIDNATNDINLASIQ